MNDIKQLISDLQLQKHPEGGWFSRVYSAPYSLQNIDRAISGSIYFLLGKREVSHFHQIDCDEIWYYHKGCGLKIYLIYSDGQLHQEILGINIAKGEKPMVIIPKGAIFAAENIIIDDFTLISCVTTPQFTFEGFKLFTQAELLKKYPEHCHIIKKMAFEKISNQS